jgi:CRP/FNR family transcriptional regulator
MSQAGADLGAKILDSGFNLEETHRFVAGQTIFRQGDHCGGIMFVLDGTIAIHQAMTPNASSLLALRETGQTLGYDSAINPAKSMTTAVALSDCRICHIGTESFGELLASDQALTRTLINHLGQELNDAYEARVRGVHLQVLARLAHLLLDLRDRHGSVDTTGNIVITIPMSRRDMASAIGSRPESLSRAIRELEKNGTAMFSGKRVVIADLDDLLDVRESQMSADPVPE